MKIVIVWVLAVLAFTAHLAVAGPLHKVKRTVSDSHLADLETRIALNNKFKGVAVTMNVGGNLIDPFKIGRKRRSQSRFLDILFNQSEEDKGDPIDLTEYEDILQRLQNIK